LFIVTFDLSEGTPVVWASHPGTKGTRYAPHESLPRLVRASMSLPLIFDPVRLEKTLHVDGGIGANFPLDIFGTGDDVIGLRFQPQRKPRKIESKADVLMACIDGLIESTTRKHIEDAVYARIIELKTKGTGLEFDLTEHEMLELMSEGEKSVDVWVKKRIQENAQ
jgi:predicted acylesterase/phospholipase RssA